MTTAREIRLKSRPSGFPSRDNFEFATMELGLPGPGEVQVRNLWMSVDPYMRGRMNDAKSYIAPFELGKALEGGAVGEVVASNAEGLQVGDLVTSMLGWRDLYNAPAGAVRKLQHLPGLPPQAHLGVAGMPGLTAYTGLTRIAGLKEGDIVFVSGAAGAVGSLACQIAKAKGHKVIGSAGGAAKVAYLKEIGCDAAIDYQAADLTAALATAAPRGIDVYFDNVGGAHLEAALAAARLFGRFALCGAISTYNPTRPSPGVRNLMFAVGKQLRLQGFIVFNHYDLMPEFQQALSGWVTEGKVTWRETVVEGLDRAPDAFLGLFQGENLGKMLVRLG